VILPAGLAAAEFPDSANPEYKLNGVKLTPEDLVTSYNNFYEWGTSKDQPKDQANHGWKTEPWTLEVAGLCASPRKFSLNELVQLVGRVERRNYRHRCVEAWSMVIPWDGFPLRKLIDLAQSTSEAKFVKFISFLDPANCPAQRANELPWPYTEGLTFTEASNELAFLAIGLYGKPLRNQNGAPIRLVVPWKYGFKGIKSIVKIRFMEKQPVSSWQRQWAAAYGFYANVNPTVAHPDWSQATEARLPSFFKNTKTLLFNGYGEEVASLYSSLDLRKNY
jgi:sulfoxide reductase catalytic subunit YedY